jgi:hypothetical protein
LLLLQLTLPELVEQRGPLPWWRRRELLDDNTAEVLFKEPLKCPKIGHGRVATSPFVKLRQAIVHVGRQDDAAADGLQGVRTAMGRW